MKKTKIIGIILLTIIITITVIKNCGVKEETYECVYCGKVVTEEPHYITTETGQDLKICKTCYVLFER